MNANGSPVGENVNLKAELAYTDSLTTVRCIAIVSNVPLSNGVFHTKLDFDCDPLTLSTVLALTPANESVAIRITDISNLSNPKAYSFQSLYSVPSSIVSRMALQIAQMSATDGQVLTWDNSANKWVPRNPGGNGTVTSISAGIGLAGGVIENSGTISIANQGVETILIKDSAVTSIKIEDGTITDADISPSAEIAQTKIKDLSTSLANKENSIASGTIGQYWSWDKSWKDFSPAVRDTFLGVNYLVVPTPGPLGASDTLLDALGKLEGQIIANDTAFDNSGQWSKSGSIIYYNTGNVGIGTSTPVEKLQVAGNLAVDGKLRLKDSGSNFVELKSPTTLSGNVTFILPSALGTNGQVLMTDASGNLSWSTPSTNSSDIVDGSIVDDDISATANIAQSKIAGLVTALSGKEPSLSLGTSAEYYRGDKTWVTLDTSAVTEGTRLYFTELRVRDTDLAGLDSTPGSVTSADTILTSIGKLTGNQGNYVLKTGATMSGNLLMGGNTVTGLAAPLLDSDAATKLYVDARWMKTGTSLYYTGGSIGVGTSTPNEKFTVDGVVSLKESVIPTATANYGKLYVKTSDSKLYFMDDAGAEVRLGSSDGGTPGSNTVSTSQIVDGTIVNADISASADIAQSKILNLATDLAAKQSADNDLTALAGLTGTGLLVRSGDGTAITRSISGTTNRLSVTNGNGVAGNPVIDISTSLLPSPLVGDAGKFLKASGANTSVWQALVSGDITTALGFTPINKSGDSVTSGVFDFNTSSVVRVLNPVGTTDVANKQYVDSQVSGAANQWSQSSGNVYRTTGNVGIGTSSPNSLLEMASAAPILQIKDTDAVLHGAGHHNKISFLDSANATTGLVGFSTSGETMILYNYNDGGDLYLGNNGGPQLAIKNGGNIGIGTTTPGQKLSVAGTIETTSGGVKFPDGTTQITAFTGSNGSAQFDSGWQAVAGSTTYSYTHGLGTTPLKVTILAKDNSTGKVINVSSQYAYGYSTYGGLSSVTMDSNYIRIRTAADRLGAFVNDSLTTGNIDFSTSTLRVLAWSNGDGPASLWSSSGTSAYYNGGNVGIGTTTPTNKLHVAGDIAVTGDLKMAGGDSYIWTNGTGSGITGIYDSANNRVLMYTSEATGYVGIGTTTPSDKLDVNGNIAIGPRLLTGLDGANNAFWAARGTGAESGRIAYGLNANPSTGVVNSAMIRTNGVERLTINSSGLVGIGSTSPAYKLHVLGNGFFDDGTSTIQLLSRPDSVLDINNSTAAKRSFSIHHYTGSSLIAQWYNCPAGACAQKMAFDTAGNMVIAGTLTQSSDRNLKKDIKPLENSLTKISTLKGVSYNWKDDSNPEKQIGLIAQEVAKVYPEVVREDKDGLLSVGYQNLIAPIIEAIKELNNKMNSSDERYKREIASLKEQNEKLQKQNELFEKRLKALEDKK